MYEDKEFENLLKKKIAWIQDDAKKQGITLDTRTASMIYFAVAGNSVETQEAYIEFEQILNECFADTASRYFLIKHCAARGIMPEPPYPGTMAIRQGDFNIDIPIGSRFSLGKLNYIAIEKISTGVFQLQCETPGIAGNYDGGALIPIDYIDGLTTALLTKVLIPGEDEEPTEHLRGRYFASLNAQAFGGNIQDYVEIVLSIDGAKGGAKVYPVWNGGGTVKIVFLNSQFQIPSDILINAVQTAIDPIPNQGMGLGLAPIGHVVTVQGVIGTTIDITTTLTYESGWGWMEIEQFVFDAVDEYFQDLAAEWDDVNWRVDPTATLTVRISQLETRLLALTGILDVENTKLNEDTKNLVLDVNAIPIRGMVTDG